MTGVLCRARISNAACVRAVLIPACGVGMWLQGSQSAAALEPRAVGSTPQRSGADRLASELPNTIEEGPLASGLAVGPTGPTGFATAYATSYSCAFEFEPCNLAEFSGVSCAEASCTAVGTAVGNTTLAEGWDGTKWNIEPTPAPSNATWSTLASVSCTAATACLAVGSYYGSSGELPLAELWNGSSWTIRPPPTPSEGSNDVLSYVQCATAKACMAVGSYYSSATSQTVPLAASGTGRPGQSRACRYQAAQKAGRSPACPAPPKLRAAQSAHIPPPALARRLSPRPGTERTGRFSPQPFPPDRAALRCTQCGASRRNRAARSGSTPVAAAVASPSRSPGMAPAGRSNPRPTQTPRATTALRTCHAHPKVSPAQPSDTAATPRSPSPGTA